jgi:hypothetical protein
MSDPYDPNQANPAGQQPPQYGPPQPSQYGPPSQPSQYGPPSQPSQYGPLQPVYPLYPNYDEPVKSGRRGKITAAAVVVVVVVAGALVSAVAFRDKGSQAGASSPQDAVRLVVNDLTKSDVLGVLDDLPPAERNALRDSFNDEVSQLKRLNVLNSNADPGKVSGVTVTTSGLTFAPTDEVINDHVRIVDVTGGTITVSSDAANVPYTQQFMNAAFPNGAPTGQSSHTVDFGQEAQQTGKPVRIGVEKVGGRWYPSLMYTIVDAANRDDGNRNPTADDAIAPAGSASPDAAVRALIDAAVKSDAGAAIAVLDPNEGAALHDYGDLLAKDAQPSEPDVRIDNTSFVDTSVSGGTRVSLHSITFTSLDDNAQGTVTINGDCLQFSAKKSQRYCAADILKLIDFADAKMTSEQKRALSDLFTSLPNVGVVTTETDGKWYVSPIRSFAELGTDVLSGLSGNDLIALIGLINQH